MNFFKNFKNKNKNNDDEASNQQNTVSEETKNEENTQSTEEPVTEAPQEDPELEAKKIKLSMDIQIRAIVEHKILPTKLNDDPVYTITSLISEKSAYIMNFYNVMYAQQQQKAENPYKEEDFDISSPYEVEGAKVIKLDMPKVNIFPTMCERVYIVYNERYTKVLYVSITVQPDGKKHMLSFIDGELEDCGVIENNEAELLAATIKDEEIAEEKYSDYIDKLMEKAKDYPTDLLKDPAEVQKYNAGFMQAIMTTQKLKQEQKPDEAFRLIREVIRKEAVKYPNTPDREFHCFRNYFEVLLFANLYHPCNPETLQKKQLIAMQVDMSTAYLILGAMMLEQRQYDKAIEILWKAVEANPVNVQLLFALADAYKGKNFLKSYYSIIKRAHVCAVNKVDIARIYRNFAYYYAQLKDYENAFMFVYASKYFDKDEKIFNAYLEQLKKESGTTFDEPELNVIKTRLASLGISWGAKELVVSVANLLTKQVTAENNQQGIKMCEQIQNELKLEN